MKYKYVVKFFLIFFLFLNSINCFKNNDKYSSSQKKTNIVSNFSYGVAHFFVMFFPTICKLTENKFHGPECHTIKPIFEISYCMINYLVLYFIIKEKIMI